jgi:transposase
MAWATDAERSAGTRWDILYFAHRSAVARPAGAVWTLYKLLQPLQPLGQSWCVVQGFRCFGGALAALALSHRQLGDPRPSACRWRQKKVGDEAIGRSRGGLSTKINALVDNRGLPLRLTLAAGQVHDVNAVPELISGLPAADAVMDRAYDADWVIELIQATGATPHIPSKQNRKEQRTVDAKVYGERNWVERFFNKIKQFRRVATRYEKTARNYLAAIALASIRLWARFESTA